MNISRLNMLLRTFEAVKNGNVNRVKYFVEQEKIDINAKDSDGYTLLQRAIIYKKHNVIDYLLQNNVNSNEKNQFDKRAIDYAYDFSIIKKLIENGTDLNLENTKGETYLHSKSYHIDIDAPTT